MEFNHFILGLEAEGCTRFHNICGNVPLEQAEIIIVGDIPDDIYVREQNIALIDHIGKESLVLVEITPREKKIKSIENDLTIGLKCSKNIMGCDHQNLEKIIKKLIEFEKKITTLEKSLRMYLRKCDYSVFFEKQKKFTEFLKLASPRLKKRSKKVFKLNHKYFPKAMEELVGKIAMRAEKVIFKIGSNLHRKIFQIRQKVIINSIKRALKSQKQIILYCAISHVIRNMLYGDEYSVESMKQFLETKKFAILFSKNSPQWVLQEIELWNFSKKSIGMHILLNGQASSDNNNYRKDFDEQQEFDKLINDLSIVD